MSRIELSTHVRCSAERLFDLSRSVEAHLDSTRATEERAVAGVTTGLLVLGDEVTWRARHFGVWQSLRVRITAYDRPQHFRDSLVSGAFRRFDHDHHFTVEDGLCVMRDVFDFDAPLGPLGTIADVLFLRRYMERFLRRRNEVLRALAETPTSR